MAEFTQITPFVLCSSLERQIAFYSETLGFECTFQADNYAYLCRSGVAVRLIECPPNADGRALGGDTSFYICVTEIDALYALMKPALDLLPNGRVRAPFNQPYGQREFHVIDEDGAIALFGEALG